MFSSYSMWVLEVVGIVFAEQLNSNFQKIKLKCCNNGWWSIYFRLLTGFKTPQSPLRSWRLAGWITICDPEKGSEIKIYYYNLFLKSLQSYNGEVWGERSKQIESHSQLWPNFRVYSRNWGNSWNRVGSTTLTLLHCSPLCLFFPFPPSKKICFLPGLHISMHS